MRILLRQHLILGPRNWAFYFKMYMKFYSANIQLFVHGTTGSPYFRLYVKIPLCQHSMLAHVTGSPYFRLYEKIPLCHHSNIGPLDCTALFLSPTFGTAMSLNIFCQLPRNKDMFQNSIYQVSTNTTRTIMSINCAAIEARNK